MQKAVDREQKVLINELTQGRELAKQLRNHLNPCSSSETREFLIQNILCSYEKALSMLNCGASVNSTRVINMLESPCSFPISSPRSDVSDEDCKDVNKKRKTMSRWNEKVRVCSETGLEGPPDDGYCWRKYGQKDILGANFPRGYYRCTHRHAQGCLATKQVQRSNEDPTIFEVTYRGGHTCCQNSQSPIASTSLTKEGSIEAKEDKPKQAQEVILNSQDATINIGTGLRVKTEELDSREHIFPSFSFSNALSGGENVGDNLFSETLMDNNFMDSLSPTFLSPTTSESNYFSMSPCHINNFGLGQNVQTSEYDLTEIISTPTSITNLPIGDLDFTHVKVDLDPSFQFDHLDFFSSS